MRKYERRGRFAARCPMVHDSEETVAMLASTERSISRFGDGELFIAFNGISLPFQRHDAALSRRLRDILRNPTERCAVALPHCYFYETERLRGDCEWYIENCFYGKMEDGGMLGDGGIDMTAEYWDTNFGIFYHHYELGHDEAMARFDAIKGLLAGRRILLVTGDTGIADYEHDIFRDAGADVSMLVAEPKNAFSSYDGLKRRVLDSCDGRLVVAICGPCATVLAYDLSNEDGVRCLDMGHFAREYNFFMKGLVPYSHAGEAAEFFTT